MSSLEADFKISQSGNQLFDGSQKVFLVAKPIISARSGRLISMDALAMDRDASISDYN